MPSLLAVTAGSVIALSRSGPLGSTELLFCALFALLIGSLGIWAGLRTLKSIALLDRWPVAKGRVTEGGAFRPTMGAANESEFVHAQVIKYTYQIGDQEFAGDRVHPERIQASRYKAAERAEARLASAGSEVTVHYNPADPAESFLVQTPRQTAYILFGVSGVALLTGVIFLLAWLGKSML